MDLSLSTNPPNARSNRPLGFVITGFIAIVIALCFLHPQRASAATFTVTNTDDVGLGSLRKAIADANTTPGPDTIAFNLSSCPCVITLTSQIAITDALTINGLGRDALVLDGSAGSNHRLLDIQNTVVHVNDLSLQNSSVFSSTGNGGAIRAQGGQTLTLTSLRFFNNRADASGGALSIEGPAFISNTEFISNAATLPGSAMCGAAMLSSSGDINASRFEGNHADGSGGAICSNSELLSLTDSDFLSNTAGTSGALYSGNVLIRGGRFENNSAVEVGSGAATILTSADISGTAFISNTGAISSTTGEINIVGAQFISNSQRAIWAKSLSLQSSQINNNSGTDDGVIHVTDQLQVNDSGFANNSAINGGAVWVTGTATISGTSFVSNTASGDGGAVWAATRITLTNSTFTGNRATGSAGAVFAQDGGAAINGTRFEGNSADSGGALAATDAEVVSSDFISNSANTNGGAAQLLNSRIIAGNFIGNSAGVTSTGNGGAVSGNALQIAGTTFLRNTAALGGGISASGLVQNSLFADNTARNGQGNEMEAISDTAISHNTFANSGLISNTGSAILLQATGTISNNIVASHTLGIESLYGPVVEDYNLFFGNGTNMTGSVGIGGHSVSGDPLFANVVADDYHLLRGSAAIDAGAASSISQDGDGEPRPQGVAPDIGFDETPFSSVPDVTLIKRAEVGHVAAGDAVTYTISYTNTGTQLATQVLITDPVPLTLSGVSYQSAGTSISVLPGPTYIWQVADLAPGTGGVITVTGIANNNLGVGTLITNTATIGSSNDQIPTNSVSSAVVEIEQPIAGLSIQGPLTITVGSSPLYTATITGGSNVSYSWSLDGNPIGVGNPISTTIYVADTYTLTVQAENPIGSATTSIPVKVIEIMYCPIMFK